MVHARRFANAAFSWDILIFLIRKGITAAIDDAVSVNPSTQLSRRQLAYKRICHLDLRSTRTSFAVF